MVFPIIIHGFPIIIHGFPIIIHGFPIIIHVFFRISHGFSPACCPPPSPSPCHWIAAIDSHLGRRHLAQTLLEKLGVAGGVVHVLADAEGLRGWTGWSGWSGWMLKHVGLEMISSGQKMEIETWASIPKAPWCWKKIPTFAIVQNHPFSR